LQRHNLIKAGKAIAEGGVTFSIAYDSCALCGRHVSKTSTCDRCPLFISLGNKTCGEGSSSPYQKWSAGNNPKPMILALERALKMEKAKK
jgi:hypothetical protein